MQPDFQLWSQSQLQVGHIPFAASALCLGETLRELDLDDMPLTC